MFMKRLIWLLGITWILVSACEEAYNFDDYRNTHVLVVEGWLTNEFKTQTIILSYSKAGPNDSITYASGADIKVNDGQNTYIFLESPDTPGLYKSTVRFAAAIDKIYRLIITLNDTIYTAVTGVLPVTAPDSIQLQYDSTRGEYRISYVAPIFSVYESALYIVYLDWSHVPGYENLPPDSTRAKLYYYTLQTMDVNEIFQPYQQQVYFPAGTIITEYKYSLTPFFATYIRALLSETQWSGSLFDVEHWNLPTNLTGGALGFFTASSVASRQYIAGEKLVKN